MSLLLSVLQCKVGGSGRQWEEVGGSGRKWEEVGGHMHFFCFNTNTPPSKDAENA